MIKRFLANFHDPSYLLKTVLLAVVYFLAAKFGLSMAITIEQVTTFWPATGIALAAILLLGFRYWPGIFLGAFLVNFATNEPALVAGGIAAGNTLEAVGGAFLLKRFGFHSAFAGIKDAIRFVLLAAIMATMISATIGTMSLGAGGLMPWRQFGTVWSIWWFGDMMGALIFGPLLLVYSQKQLREKILERLLEFGFSWAVILATAMLVFTQEISNLPRFFTLYALFPLIIWMAIRFVHIGVVTATLTIAMVGFWSIDGRLGLFASGAIEESLMLLQMFLAIVSITALLLATAVNRQMGIESSLRSKKLELEAAQAKISAELREKGKLESHLKDANARITNILEEILEQDVALDRTKQSKDDRAEV